MFPRERKTKKGWMIDILSAFRDKKGNPTNKQVGCLGPFQSLDNPALKSLALKIYAIGKKDSIDLKELAPTDSGVGILELSRRNLGTPMVVYNLWRKLGIERILEKVRRLHPRLQLDLNAAVLLPVIKSLADPASLLRTYAEKSKLAGEYDVELHQLYRALDLLAAHKNDIEWMFFDKRRDLFNQTVDLVFFDTTTFYFDSQRETSLLRKGFSKDGKFADVQIVFGMMIDRTGRPIGYDYFPGNTADVSTLASAAEAIKKRFKLGRITLVGDSGILSRKNLQLLDKYDIHFIVSARLRMLPAAKKREILDRERFQRSAGEDGVSIYETEHEGRRLIVTYSEKRARKDVHEREKLLVKLEKKLENGKKAAVGGHYARFLIIREKPVIDKDAVAKDARFDGFRGMITDNENLSGAQVVENYRFLWKIEESFRLMKSQLEIRPMFVWTDKRIAGHLMMSFLAFGVLRELELVAKAAGIEDSIERICRALADLQVSELDVGGEGYLLRSCVPELAAKVFKTLKIRMPASFRPIENGISGLPLPLLMSHGPE